MSVYDKIKRCKDGTLRYLNQQPKGAKDENGISVGGQFMKSDSRFYNGQKVGVWNKEPQQKIVPEIEDKNYVKGNFYRASISLNVGVNSSKNHPNYRNFTYVVVDLKENINMKDMYEKLIEGIESKEGLHYKRCDFWFDYDYNDCDKQFPKPYSARYESATFEGGN